MIAVDWGTSNLRAFRLDGGGAVIDRRESAEGITQVADGAFAATLRAVVGPWLADGETRVLMCGMIGSRQGWVEAPYLPCPADPAALAGALVAVPFDEAQVRLVPGLSARDADGTPEVMRGEETKLLALLQHMGGDGLVCLPGTHTKWVRLQGGRIAGFATCMSGETFGALRDGTILGRMMRHAGPVDPGGFDRGVARSGEGGHLLHHLFGVRTLGLFGELDEAESAGYLSGLLIGHEARAMAPRGAVVHLAGDEMLTGLYARAIGAAGAQVAMLDEDVAAQGLAIIGRAAGWL
jgi:2-dehydro-3-deoxygalactonokinase